MEEAQAVSIIVKTIADNGVLVVIAAVFLWSIVTQTKNMTRIMAELAATMQSVKASSESVSVAVNVIKDLVMDEMHQQKEHYIVMDYMNKDVKETAEISRWIKERLIQKQ